MTKKESHIVKTEIEKRLSPLSSNYKVNIRRVKRNKEIFGIYVIPIKDEKFHHEAIQNAYFKLVEMMLPHYIFDRNSNFIKII